MSDQEEYDEGMRGHFEMFPLKGILFRPADGGEQVWLKLGSKRAEIANCPFAEYLSFDFSDGDLVFIECSRGVDVRYDGMKILATPASEIIEKLGDALKDVESGHSFVDPELELCFWRSTDENRLFDSIAIGLPPRFSSWCEDS